jgi:membrane protein YqaA with SNARE-associated domain
LRERSRTTAAGRGEFRVPAAEKSIVKPNARSPVMELTALFVAAFLAATILPLASEVPLALIVRREGDLVWPVVVATLGNYLGACTTYGLARAAAARLAAAAAARSSRALIWFHRYGPPALVLSWVPVAGDGLVALAGATSVPFGVFSFWTAIGKAGRYLVVAWIALS